MNLVRLQAVHDRIQEFAGGEPFTVAAFLDLGNRAAIGLTLSRLAKAGAISRAVPGVYVRPELSKLFGKIPVLPEAVAKAIVCSRGGLVQMSGGEAANRLGLSKHVPMKPVLLVAGRSRTLTLSGRTVELRHVGKRAMVGAGTPAGPIVSALHYLGRHQVGEKEIQILKNRLTKEQTEAIRTVLNQVPRWMAAVLQSVIENSKAPEGLKNTTE